MGGKNHQPCGQYLANSTKMSRFMSLAFIELEMANVALEDVILAELHGDIGKAENIISHLTVSDVHLDGMTNSIYDLRKQMVELDYQDLPPLKTIDLDTFGESLREEGLLDSSDAWTEVTEIMNTQGFWGMLPAFEERIGDIKKMTTELRNKVAGLYKQAEDGELYLTLEQNLDGNFKAEFASLYTAWASFQQFFLASSLLSTEVWYEFNQNGSLVENTGVRAVA